MDVETNKVLSADGAIHYSIFAIGEVTAGEVYYISAMTKLRNAAETIARQIVGDIDLRS